MIYDHAYVGGPDHLPDPNNCPTTHMLMYADGNGVGVSMHEEMTLDFPCFDWAARGWSESMMLRYRPAVANAVMGRFDRTNTSGLMAFGPSRFQTIFGDSVDSIQAPSLLEALRTQNRLPAIREPGTVIYCAFRPMLLYEETDTGYHILPNEPEHWLAINGWPFIHQPPWSERIYTESQSGMLDKHWKIRLLSMSFVIWNSDTKEFENIAAAPLTFGDGLIVHLDFGALTLS
ncbi:hypothetical protein BD309DRAFT_356242 [Dichomitus squalens]|nr:hypothetical protein BD309DRAFT_356242 [Dichomitus squalens]